MEGEMPRAPTRIQNGTFGGDNPSSFTPSYANRAAVRPNVTPRGPSQALEQFSEVNLPDTAAVARALNQLQKNVQAAVAVTKNAPQANGNMIENVTFSTSGPTIVKHGLGGPAKGFVIHNAVGVDIVTRVTQTDLLEQNQISLDSQGYSLTADVWVYLG
jgi:hypothetical protein